VFAHAVFGAVIFFNEYAHLTKVISTLILAFVMTVTINDYFARHKPEIPMDKILGVLKRSFALCVIVGSLQLMAKWNIIPFGFSDIFTNFFSYRTVHRLQMLSGEPSWMYRHLLFFFCFFIGIKSFRHKWLYVCITLFFMVVSGTTYGYVITCIGFLLYVLLFNQAILFNRYIAITLVVFSISFSYLFRNVFDQYTVEKIKLVAEVAREPESIQEYLEKDGSAFQRFMNPYIAFRSGFYSYGFGTGLDTYRYVYPEYILSDYRYAMKHPTVREAVEGENYITPKSLYAKIYTELGILAFVAVLIALLILIIRIKYLPKGSSYRLFLECAIISVIVYGINNDSIIFVNSYFLLYFIGYLSKKSNHIKINARSA
jgi:hypothetical protein